MRVDLSNSWKRSSEPEQFSNLSATQILIQETTGLWPDLHVLVSIDQLFSRAGVQPRLRVTLKHVLKSVCCHGIAFIHRRSLTNPAFCRVVSPPIGLMHLVTLKGGDLVLCSLICSVAYVLV